MRSFANRDALCEAAVGHRHCITLVGYILRSPGVPQRCDCFLSVAGQRRHAEYEGGRTVPAQGIGAYPCYFAVSVWYMGFPLFQRSQHLAQCTACRAHTGSFSERFAAHGGLPLSLRATHVHTEQLTCDPAAASRVPLEDANTGGCATAIELALAVASELGQPISSWVPPSTTHKCTVNGSTAETSTLSATSHLYHARLETAHM
jgi:hypothetical protein